MNFDILYITSLIILVSASIFAFYDKGRKIVNILMVIYLLLWTFWFFVLWLTLERAPFKTVGETRLFYSYLVPIISWLLFVVHKWKWILTYGSLIGIVFIFLNVIYPENYTKELLPALRSIWFVPHVLVYMFAYALFGVSTIIAIHVLVSKSEMKAENLIKLSQSLIRTGFAFLTLGLLFGALWAKQAWGNYWTWDPKEIWALATWFFYMFYLHLYKLHYSRIKLNAVILIIAFFILLISWFGVYYLPAASFSIHLY